MQKTNEFQGRPLNEETENRKSAENFIFFCHF